MKAIGFKVGNYTSKRTGEVSKKLLVKFDNATELFIWLNRPEFTGLELEASIDLIKKDRDMYLSQIIVADTQFGQQAQFSIIADAEEF